jgi:hypothetical protein
MAGSRNKALLKEARPIPSVCPFVPAPLDPRADPEQIRRKACGSRNISGPFYTEKRAAKLTVEGLVDELPVVNRAWFCKDCGEDGVEEFHGYPPGEVHPPLSASLLQRTAPGARRGARR